MRTTFNAINRHTQYVIENKYADLSNLQQQIATGKALTRPSDDAVGVTNVLALRNNNFQLKQFEKNTNDGLSWMEISDTTMMSMTTVLQRGRQIAIQGDSDTISATERKYLGQEVQQLTRQLISLANSKFKGDYLFSGSQTDKPPVPIVSSEAKNPVSYTAYKMSYFDGTGAVRGSVLPIFNPRGSGSIADREAVTNIIPGSFTLFSGDINNATPTEFIEGTDFKMDYSNGTLTILNGISNAKLAILANNFTPGAGNYTNGSSANNIRMNFDYASQSRDIYDRPINTNSGIFREVESGVKFEINTSIDDFTLNNNTNMITSMIKLGESLLGNSQPGIRASIDLIDTSFSKILGAQSENGAKANLCRSASERNDVQQTETTRAQSLIEDADYADVMSRYTISQSVFNAALQSTSKIMQSSLANYI